MEFYTSVERIGGTIFYRGVKNGKRVKSKVKYEPTLYWNANKESNSEWKSLFGESVTPKKFDSIREANNFVEQYADVNGISIFGNTNYIASFMQERFPDHIDFDLDQINVVTIDIEVASDDGFPEPDLAEKEVVSITLKSNQDDTFYVWGLYDYDASLNPNKVSYRKCKSEKELLSNFMLHWVRNYPDIITGWYSRMFDMPYLINRIHNVFGEKQGPIVAAKFSPWDKVEMKTIAMMKKQVAVYQIYGIQQLDYLDLFKKFAYTYGSQESYKLDSIAHVVLGERKLSYEEYGNLNALYKKNFQKFLDYNIKDVRLVEQLDEKLGLINLALTMAYRAGVNFSDTFGTTAIWDSIIYRECCNRKLAIPQKKESPKVEYVGGYVKDVTPGMNEWVCSFDLNSLYPNIIAQWNMSPETLVGMQEEMPTIEEVLYSTDLPSIGDGENTIAMNGAMFTKHKQGVIPSIIVDYYNERVSVRKTLGKIKQEIKNGSTKELEAKKAKLDNTQTAIKILLNSLYGAYGNRFFRYYDARVAAAVTTTGQLSIRWAEKAVNNKLVELLKKEDDYVVAIDTDSLYIRLDEVVKRMFDDPTEMPLSKISGKLDSVCKKVLSPVINSAYDDLFAYMNCYEKRLEMKRESIANKSIWTAKKKYLLSVVDDEGIINEEPEIKVKGIESVRSSTPEICRDVLKKSFEVIMKEDEESIQKLVSDFKREFMSKEPYEIAFPRGINGMDNYGDPDKIYKSATPIHVRGALLYNHHVANKGLTNKYFSIKDGDKVKFVYLKMPNPIHENIIAFTDQFPLELGIYDYIDYDTQFEKAFVSPLRLILDAIGWNHEKVATLDAFM